MNEKLRHNIFLEQAAEIAGIGHWIYDENGQRYLYVSSYYARIYGKSQDEILGEKISEEDDLADVHKDDVDTVLAAYEKCRQDGEKYSIEYRITRFNDGLRWIHEIGSGLEKVDGAWTTTIGTIQDITERKEREQSLADREYKLQSIFSNSKVGIGRTRFADGKVLEANDKLARMFGYDDTEEFIETFNFADHFVDKHARNFLVENFRNNPDQITESDYRTRNGSIVSISSHGHYNEAEGHIDFLFLDITERTKAERALHESELRFKDFAEAASDWYWEMGPDLRFSYFSKRLDITIGAPRSELIGKTRQELGKPEIDDEKWIEHLDALENHEPFRDFEYGFRRKDGTTAHVRVSGMPVFAGNGDFLGYRGTGNDITERKDAELVALIANRAKSDLMANMSHELRTPLNAIIGFSGMIKDETFGPIGSEKYKQYLEDIQHSGQHLLELINDILDVSAIEAGAMELQEEYINLSNVVEASVRLIRPRAETGDVTITASIDPDCPQIYADERRIKQVLLNLLSNAVKFTREGGEVSVNSWLNDDGSLSAAISDSGIGMAPEDVDKALSKFGQVDSGLDRQHEGSGLGLPLTKGLMDLHGGALEIRSKKNQGTIVTLTFPSERIVLSA